MLRQLLSPYALQIFLPKVLYGGLEYRYEKVVPDLVRHLAYKGTMWIYLLGGTADKAITMTILVGITVGRQVMLRLVY